MDGGPPCDCAPAGSCLCGNFNEPSEPNDVECAAHPLHTFTATGSTTATYEGFRIVCGADEDWYRIDVNDLFQPCIDVALDAPEGVRMEMTYVCAGGLTAIWACDKSETLDGGTCGSTVSGANVEFVQVTLIACTSTSGPFDGYALVRVLSDGSAQCKGYDLTVSRASNCPSHN